MEKKIFLKIAIFGFWRLREIVEQLYHFAQINILSGQLTKVFLLESLKNGEIYNLDYGKFC